MSFLDNVFNAENEGAPNGWQTLNTIEQLQEIINMSFQRPQVVFKHSVRCGISSMAKYQLEREWDFAPEEMDFYYLDLINYRAVSNKVADLFGVVHQSPQLILIKDGKAVFNTSHHAISVPRLRTALETL